MTDLSKHTHLWRWVDGEFQFALFAEINGQTFHDERTESTARAAAERVENEKSL